MNKKELLKQYPDLIKEITGEIYSEHIQGSNKLNDFNKLFESYVFKQTNDYQIISFKHTYGSIFSQVYNKENEFQQTLDGTIHSLKDMLKDESMQINSIKKLSTNEVFTIGEEVNISIPESNITMIKTIKSFRYNFFIKNEYAVHFGHDSHDYNIDYLTKLVPIFETEDFVEIFINSKDILYAVQYNCGNFKYFKATQRNLFTMKMFNLAFCPHILENYEQYSKCYKFFASSDKAEKYLKLNKPIFSYLEIENIFSNRTTPHTADTLYTFKQICLNKK